MGSVVWSFVAKWEPDLRAALLRAQQETLSTGSFAQLYKPDGRLETVKDVRDAYGADGSGSVIDILDLAEEPGLEVAGPFEAEVLLDLFGTTRPTRDAVLLKSFEIEGLLGRGEAAYVLLYEGETPREIFFCGWTAD